MKRSHFLVACSLLAFTGCTCGQGSICGRSNFLGQLHDRIHGAKNVGAPCMSPTCAAPAMAAPAAMANSGCDTCGSGVQSMGYESYPSSYDGEVIGGGYSTVVPGTSGPVSESIAPMRAQ